ncbi:MAG: hypothetical protein QF733_02915 [Phycisphaerales bacterium]|jgi:hypothetical protein|nr:hypothetical protein [Phycisphaerales bacterium]
MSAPTVPCKRRLHPIASVIGVCIFAASSFAQGLTGIPGLMKPEYFSRDLLLFIEGLNLTEEQQAITEVIFDDYEREFHAGIDAMQMQVEDVAHNVGALGDDKDAIVAAVLSPIQGWAGQRDVLGRQLVDNVRVILDADQQALWTAFNRRLEREKLLPQGQLWGESTNIEHILRDLPYEVKPDTPLAAAMSEWEFSLGAALRERADVSNQGLNLIQQIKADSSNEEDLRRRRKELDVRIRIRDINDHAIETIAPLLAADGPTFRRKALQFGYARIFRVTPEERLFNAALKNQTIRDNASLYAAVQDLHAAFMGELNAINLILLDTARAWQPELEESKIANRLRRLNGQTMLRPDDPTRPLYQDRRKITARYVQLLRDLLGDDLFASLDGAARFMPRKRQADPDAGRETREGRGGISTSGSAGPDPDYGLGKKRGAGVPKPAGLTGGRGGDD